MTVAEFSDAFDSLVDSYRRFKDFDKKEELDSIEFNEYEKSLYLTMAQEEVVVNLYSGRNSYGEAFETTEEMRRYLDALVKFDNDFTIVSDNNKVSSSSVVYGLPDDIAYIIYEQAQINDDDAGCLNGSLLDVLPVTHDEYNRIRRNPFRGANGRRILRLDRGDNKIELVSKYEIKSYIIRYLAKPAPIILENLTDTGLTINNEQEAAGCALNSLLHPLILKRAVQMALASKGISINN